MNLSRQEVYTEWEREYGQKAGGLGRGFAKEPSNDDYKNNKQTTAKVHQLPQSLCILRVVNTYTFSQNGCQTKVTSLKGRTLAKFQYMLYVHDSVCIWPWVFPSIIFVRCYFYDFVLHFPFVLVILLHFCARINSSKRGGGIRARGSSKTLLANITAIVAKRDGQLLCIAYYMDPNCTRLLYHPFRYDERSDLRSYIYMVG